MYLGNIIVSESLSANTLPNNVQEIKIDEYKESNTPTLIIGWENTKKLYPETSILKKEIKENLYWTFSTHEKRGIFQDDLKSFVDKINKDIYDSLGFVNIDPILYNLKDEKTLMGRLERFSGSFGYLYTNKFYFYHDNKIYHIDFDLLNFIGFDIDSIESFLNTNFKMIKDVNYSDVEMKYIPYVYSKDAEKSNTISDIH